MGAYFQCAVYWAGPQVANGADTDVTVSLIDIYPTLVEMCKLPKPRQILEGLPDCNAA